MNAYQIKCYLFPPNSTTTVNSIKQVTEIRRFALPNVSSDYLYRELVDKIQLSFGSLLPNRDEIRTYWQDEENELVGFSSSNELQYALDLHLAIRLSQPQQPYQTPSQINIFKIYIARKSNKQDEYLPKSDSFDSTSNDEQQIHFGVVCDGCDGRIVGIRHKCKVCPDYDLCSTCKAKNIHNQHEFTEIEKPLFSRSKCPYASGRFHGRHGHGHKASHGCGNGARSSSSTENPFSNFIPLLSQIPLVSDPQQLKNVGEYLKGFMDQFGIDVDYYVSTNNNNPSPSEEKEKKEEKKNDEESSEKKFDLLTSSKMDTTSTSDSDKEKSVNPADILIPTTVSSSDQPAVSSLIDLKPSNSSEVAPSPYEEASKALKIAIEKEKQTEVNASKLTPNRDEDTTMAEESGFNLVDIEKELKIIKSIEILKTMGYSDDGGWLTRLVSAKNGNINAVLDAISPSKN